MVSSGAAWVGLEHFTHTSGAWVLAGSWELASSPPGNSFCPEEGLSSSRNLDQSFLHGGWLLRVHAVFKACLCTPPTHQSEEDPQDVVGTNCNGKEKESLVLTLTIGI